jgi:hypothetical protein
LEFPEGPAPGEPGSDGDPGDLVSRTKARPVLAENPGDSGGARIAEAVDVIEMSLGRNASALTNRSQHREIRLVADERTAFGIPRLREELLERGECFANGEVLDLRPVLGEVLADGDADFPPPLGVRIQANVPNSEEGLRKSFR